MQKITWKEGLDQLEKMFPTINPKVIEQTLRDNKGHMENTIDVLLCLNEEVNEQIEIENNKEIMTDEELAKQIQEHEFGMYKALGGRKTMNEFLNQMENPNKNVNQNSKVKSFWDQLSENAKNVFKQMFYSDYQYNPLGGDDPESLFFFYYYFLKHFLYKI